MKTHKTAKHQKTLTHCFKT
ncbi:hypothetical protein DIL84_07280 [Salmonella enterica]|nr:hypothetical protein [Salmonella enterica]